MTCPEWEARIALAVEGDAPAGEVEAHLAACPGCREFAEELRASQSAFKELREEAVDQAMLDAIRGRAMAAIAAAAPRRPARWWWALAPAAAAVAILLVMIMRVPEPRAPAGGFRGAGFSPRGASAPLPASRAEARPRPKGRPTSGRREPLLMKIVTDDPDVVIYWIVEDKQKGE